MPGTEIMFNVLMYGVIETRLTSYPQLLDDLVGVVMHKEIKRKRNAEVAEVYII
jgi:hypothetical protein